MNDTSGCQNKVYELGLHYPRNNKCDTIQIWLSDVRAADDIQVSYDFERDGWVVKQASKFEWDDDDDDDACDADWQEVAFIKAWARDRNRK